MAISYTYKGFTVICRNADTVVILNLLNSIKYLNNNSDLIDERYEFADYIDAEQAINNFR